MLLLFIDRKNSQRDELLLIFIEDKMAEIIDFFSVKKIWGSFFPISLSARTDEHWNRDDVARPAGFRQLMMSVI